MFEQVLEEEMDEHLQARPYEHLQARRDERNGHYRRRLVTESGLIEQLHVPHARQTSFLTEVFERYERLTDSMEEAVLEMYLQGVSTWKVEQITSRLSGVRISKDAVSRITARLEEALNAWRVRHLEGSYPYLYLDATYLKVAWAGAVR